MPCGTSLCNVVVLVYVLTLLGSLFRMFPGFAECSSKKLFHSISVEGFADLNIAMIM